MDVILLMAMTLDGKIARNSAEHVDWSGKEDKEYFVKVTKETGVMIMGSKTYDTIGRPLPGRKNIVMTRNKERISDHTDLVFTDTPPKGILEELRSEGFQRVALVGGATINSLFAIESLITEIHITVVPTVFGQGLSIFDKSLDLALELKEHSLIGTNHLLLKYKVL